MELPDEMKRSQPTTFNCYKRCRPSDGNRTIARGPLPNTAASLIETSATATLLDAQDTQGMGTGVGVYVGTEEWSADRSGYPRYTSIWTPD